MSINGSVNRLKLSEPSIDSVKQARLLDFIQQRTGSVVNFFNPFKLLELLVKFEETPGQAICSKLAKNESDLCAMQAELAHLIACIRD